MLKVLSLLYRPVDPGVSASDQAETDLHREHPVFCQRPSKLTELDVREFQPEPLVLSLVPVVKSPFATVHNGAPCDYVFRIVISGVHWITRRMNGGLFGRKYSFSTAYDNIGRMFGRCYNGPNFELR